MTKYEAHELEKFLKEIDGHDYYFQPDNIPSPATLVTLYNPRLPLRTLFRVFECFRRPTRRVDNVVDTLLLKESFSDEHRFDYPYFFQVSVPGFHVDIINKGNVVGLTGHLEYTREVTMTAAEAVLYLLFYQFRGEPAPLSCPIVTLTTTNSMKIPLMVGFDEEDICNKIQLYNANQPQSIATKEVTVYTRQ